MGGGHFEGLEDVLERFLTSIYGAFDVRFLADEFISTGDSRGDRTHRGKEP